MKIKQYIYDDWIGIDFEFRNGWQKEERRYYGFSPLGLNFLWHLKIFHIYIAILGFELVISIGDI